MARLWALRTAENRCPSPSVSAKRVTGSDDAGAGFSVHAAAPTIAPVTSGDRRNGPLPERARRSGGRQSGRLWSRRLERARQREAHVTNIANALARVLHQTAAQVRPERRREGRRQRGPVRVAVDHARKDMRNVLAGKRRRPRQHLEQHDAESPNVRAFIDGLPARLLRAASSASAICFAMGSASSRGFLVPACSGSPLRPDR
jgi:hypothetical protein